MDTNYSLSDIAAVSNEGFGGSNAWILIILFAMIFGGGGFFGRNDGFGLVVAALTYFAGKIIDYRIFLVAVTIVMLILVARMNKWLRTKGTEIFVTL